MNIPDTVRTYISRIGGQYKGLRFHPTGSFEKDLKSAQIPPRKLVRATLLRSGRGYILAVYPADRILDFPSLEEVCKRPVQICDAAAIREMFPKCDIHAIPPIGEAYGIHVIQDRTLTRVSEVFFATGTPGLLLGTEGKTFQRLLADANSRHVITREDPKFLRPRERRLTFKERVQAVDKLPVMPKIATEILAYRGNAYVTAAEIASVVEQDPGLAAQLMRYATSPLYGYGGKVDSVQTAISRVLGIDFVIDLAFGLSLGRAFRNPPNGPIGLNAFWHHSVSCALLTQLLCEEIEFYRRPPSSMGYLAGLLHNFGFLLLGHLFEAEFTKLNRVLARFPDKQVTMVERAALGVTHMELGQWLMQSWAMPKEIVEAVRFHHDPEHRGNHAIFANLIFIANALLKKRGIGDSAKTEISDELLSRVHLNRPQLAAALAKLESAREGLQSISSGMAA